MWLAYLIVVLVIWLIIFSATAVVFVQTFFVTKQAPFVPMPRAVVKRVVRVLGLHDNAVLYDLGCGDGRVLSACLKICPTIYCYGFDMSWLAVFLARTRVWLVGGRGRIVIHCKDLLKADLREATHIFTYLFPGIMDELLPKLVAELRPGTRLVSCDFSFSEKKPLEVIDLGRAEWQLGRKLYVYEF